MPALELGSHRNSYVQFACLKMLTSVHVCTLLLDRHITSSLVNATALNFVYIATLSLISCLAVQLSHYYIYRVRLRLVLPNQLRPVAPTKLQTDAAMAPPP